MMGIPFLDDHLDRLYEAALYVDMEIGKTRSELVQAIRDTLAASDMRTDVHIRLMITRGRKKKPFQHPHLSVWGPTIVIIAEHSNQMTAWWTEASAVHRSASSRAAADTGRQAQLPFQAELHHRAEPCHTRRRR